MVAEQRGNPYAMPPSASKSEQLSGQAPAQQTPRPAGERTAMPGATRTVITHDPKNPKLRVIPIGGLQEIGNNMTLLEYGDDIVLIDMGFLFPDSSMLGVDYLIPNVSYLADKKDKVRGCVITHGHLDHIGAVAYLMEPCGFPTLYGTPITMGLVSKRLEEFSLLGKSKLVSIDPHKDLIQLGAFRIRPFHLVHSIPGAIGLEIETPNGRLVYATDWKFDHTPADNKPASLQELALIGARGVDLFFSDSTNADKPGFTISEKVVENELREVINDATGRVVVGMFASNLNRIQQTINAAHSAGRKVLILGRSMVQNVELAVNLRAITFPKDTLIQEREFNRFPDEKVLVLCTGSQGEEKAALNRMAAGEHRIVKIRRGDTVILSSSPIPGNERSIDALKDVLYKAGANVVYNATHDVHTSGHAYQEELKLMLGLMRPQHFLPIHGERSKRITHGKLATEVAGVLPENILLGDNGTVVEMDYTGKVTISDEQINAEHVIVDGLGVGDVGSIVLDDRRILGQEGMFIVVFGYDVKAKQFVGNPDIISRGFIYVRENERFVQEVRNDAKRLMTELLAKGRSMDQIKEETREYLQKLLFAKTEREPMVIPVIVEV